MNHSLLEAWCEVYPERDEDASELCFERTMGS